MTKIKSVIIDDELANRALLASLIKKYCPEIEVSGFADSAETAYGLINQLKPEVIFLDINMPEKNGFDLLRMFSTIDFHVIFVSGFDEYAIQAFEFNAVDYILKPIDHTKLITAVKKIVDRTLHKNNQNIIHFIHSIDEKNQLIKNITLHHNDKVHVVDLNDICFIKALRGYSEIITINNQKMVSSKTLSDYEELLNTMPQFLRVNKSVIINIHYITNYTKGAVCFLDVKNNSEIIEVSRRKKTEIVQYLKQQYV